MKNRGKILIILVSIIVISIACGTNNGVVVEPPNQNTSSSGQSDGGSDSAPEPTAPPVGTTRGNPAPVGSKVTVDDMEFVILGVTRPANDIVMAGNMFNTEPEEGQEYMFVSVQVTCAKSSDETCSVGIYNITLVGSAGVSRDAEWFVTGVDGLLDSSEFYGGATVTGNIPFIVNVDETDLVFVYEPLFGDAFYLAVP